MWTQSRTLLRRAAWVPVAGLMLALGAGAGTQPDLGAKPEPTATKNVLPAGGVQALAYRGGAPRAVPVQRGGLGGALGDALGRSGMLSSATAEDIAHILDGMNVTYEQGTDQQGDPMFTVMLGDYKTLLFTYDPDENGRYQSLALYAGFAFKEKPAMEVTNTWNQEKRHSRAYIDGEGDPVIETDLLLRGGVSSQAVAEWLDLFGLSVRVFADHIGWAEQVGGGGDAVG